MDRRTFLARGLFLAPALVGHPRASWAGFPATSRRDSAHYRRPLRALATADTEAHVVVLDAATARVLARVRTREGPRSIEALGGGRALVAHTALGCISLLGGSPLRVQRVLGGFSEPRYTAVARDGRHAFVTDSGTGEIAVVDLERRRVAHRARVGEQARHVTLSPDGRELWVALGSSAPAIAVLDVREALRPRVVRHVRTGFLAHDVAFSPSGRRVWVSAARERRLAVLDARAGGRPPRGLGAPAAPQHLAFGPGVAYVTGGGDGTLRVLALRDGRVLREAAVPRGSYNVSCAHGRVVTPSLGAGTVALLDARGVALRRTHVAPAAHDACLI